MARVDGQLVKDFVTALGFETTSVIDVKINPNHVVVTHLARDEQGRNQGASFVSYLPIVWPDAEGSQDSE